jgi:hypothetical protein
MSVKEPSGDRLCNGGVRVAAANLRATASARGSEAWRWNYGNERAIRHHDPFEPQAIKSEHSKPKRIDTSSVNRSIFAPSPITSSEVLAIPKRLGRVRCVGGLLNTVEDDNRADRDDGRCNASGDEDAHRRIPEDALIRPH